ncbi:Diphosphomevalonate decarboxylase [Ramicandelaber brevisporus]|nr:Diphosphomevalonate decarboxylase [Ramicandelaber brevisporus]
MTATFFEATCTSPVNIAVVKYWAKRDTELILPTNSSLSCTLSQDKLHSRTTIRADPSFTADRLWLNGQERPVATDSRLVNCISTARARRAAIEAADSSKPKFSQWYLHIVSENNFPTAAGLASSASGLACLVSTLHELYQLNMTPSELSILARLGSGSACRSVMGGFVAWEMGKHDDGSDSFARQVAPETHWPELEALICVVSDAKKLIGSTNGMQNTLATSPLIQHRIKHVVPRVMQGMEAAIHAKDFEAFGKLTMQDSNSFHAVCLDTYPPIMYLNDVSRAIIRAVHAYNDSGDGKIKAAYTFDAGPNAVIYAEKQHMDALVKLVSHYFPPSADNKEEYYSLAQSAIGNGGNQLDGFKWEALDVFPENSVKKLIHAPIADGPRVVKDKEGALIGDDGLPKRK